VSSRLEIRSASVKPVEKLVESKKVGPESVLPWELSGNPEARQTQRRLTDPGNCAWCSSACKRLFQMDATKRPFGWDTRAAFLPDLFYLLTADHIQITNQVQHGMRESA